MNIIKSVLAVLFGLTIVFSLVAFASACAESQLIMKLNKTTDSHGALWSSSDSDYGTQICFDSFTANNAQFVPGATDAHSCTGVNPLFYLSGTSNAHASNESSADYPDADKVCYQGLTNCEIVNSQICPAGKTPIISLSNYTNAHLASIQGGYSYTACCRVAGGGNPPETGPTPKKCMDYGDSSFGSWNSKSKCEGDSLGVANSDSRCTKRGSCYCWWNNTATQIINRCNFAQDFNDRCLCVIDYKNETLCENGVKTVNNKMHLEPKPGRPATDCPSSLGCTGDSVNSNVPCGPAGELPFFGGLQFVLTLTGILLIYSAFAMLRKYS